MIPNSAGASPELCVDRTESAPARHAWLGGTNVTTTDVFISFTNPVQRETPDEIMIVIEDQREKLKYTRRKGKNA